MSRYAAPADDLDATLRWALRAAVADAEPPARTWRRIRQRLEAGESERQRARRQAWAPSAVPVLAICVVLAAFGVSVGLQGPSEPVIWPAVRATEESIRQAWVTEVGPQDALSARRLWLTREAARAQEEWRELRWMQ